MNNLNSWAIKHHVSQEALNELREMFGMIITDPLVMGKEPHGSEAEALNLVRLEASRKGLRLWRNNVGVVQTDDNRIVRFGLCNDSKRMNDSVKSSDLVGIRPVKITVHHIGMVFGQFVAREVKRPGWNFTGTQREEAQLNFLKLVQSLGGDAAFVTGEGSL